MRILILILVLLFIFKTAFAQKRVTVDSFSQILSPLVEDSLKRLLSASKEDSNRVLILHQLSYPVLFSRPDSAMYFALEGVKLARSINYQKGLSLCKADIGAVWWIIGNYSKANEILLESAKSAESINDAPALEWSLAFLLSSYRDEGKYDEALKYCSKAASIHQYLDEKVWNVITGSIYVGMNKLDTALFYLQHGDSGSYNLLMLGHTYEKKSKNALALDFYKKSTEKFLAENNLKDLADAYYSLARLYEKENKHGSSPNSHAPESLRYFKLATSTRERIFNLQKITETINSEYTAQLRQKEAETAIMNYQNKVRTEGLLAVLSFLLLLAIFLYKNNRQKQKAKLAIEKAYEKLKLTQAQLVQSEKMASLGELTAGIAHEIQNPLNFVTNFSEVNKELLLEMNDEIDKGNLIEVKSIAKDLIDNQEKINHHGKRADSIVKGMLQHSRSSGRIKESTDINALADEYLRLSYHGLRAKDNSFNATMKTDFDESIGNINIIPQDIGRVLLNLYNNAFYAVSEKNKNCQPLERGKEYEPTVMISTKFLKPSTTGRGSEILISVKDNGNGIPQKVVDKIFQPFFTTKPAGQGTGLGLSLSYDIVKAHGGELKVESKEGEFTELVVQLPLTE